ncbi:hypothetical protein AB1287_17300 [Enterobacter asburiae]|uniref:hypothetical protein n=1 Tax=Scandinavium sp. UTDF21-P1B TaxID=3446379 RepID=UPI00349527C9
MRRFIILVLLFLTVSCSSFFSEETEQKSHNIEITLFTEWNVNQNEFSVSQPVKLCVIEVRRAGWLPARLYEGRICSEPSDAVDVINYESYIVAPGQKRIYQAAYPTGAINPRWILIGAEFQQGIGARSLIEKEIKPGEDFKLNVVVEKTSLTVL